MTYYYTHQDSQLTVLFPEALEIERFELIEVISNACGTLLNPPQTHFLKLTVQGEDQASELIQELHRVITEKSCIQVAVIRNGSVIRDLNVVVSESANDYCLSVKA